MHLPSSISLQDGEEIIWQGRAQLPAQRWSEYIPLLILIVLLVNSFRILYPTAPPHHAPRFLFIQFHPRTAHHLHRSLCCCPHSQTQDSFQAVLPLHQSPCHQLHHRHRKPHPYPPGRKHPGLHYQTAWLRPHQHPETRKHRDRNLTPPCSLPTFRLPFCSITHRKLNLDKKG